MPVRAAGLSLDGAIVAVGPPLSRSGPSIGYFVNGDPKTVPCSRALIDVHLVARRFMQWSFGPFENNVVAIAIAQQRQAISSRIAAFFFEAQIGIYEHSIPRQLRREGAAAY